MTSAPSILIVAVLIAIAYCSRSKAISLMTVDVRNESAFFLNFKTLKNVTLGYDELLCDILWLEFLQYIGNTQCRQLDHYADVSKYVEAITSLDSHFIPIYYFAAFLLGSDRNEPEQAALILDNGILANSKRWELRFIAGINQFLYAKNRRRAAKYYREAASLPNAPEWLPRQAEMLESDSPSLALQINTWYKIFKSASDLSIKLRARKALSSLYSTLYRTAKSAEVREASLRELKRLDSNVRLEK